jgi:hypothetical protein
MEDKDLPNLYRSAHNFAYEKVKVQNIERRSSGPSNPTQDAAVYEASRRRKIEAAWRKLDRCCREIESARAMLMQSLPDEPHIAGDPDPLPDTGDRYRKEGQANQRKRAMFQWDPTSSEVV